MKCLKRNQRDIWYAKRLSETYVTDNNGLKTGERQQTYDTPVKLRMNVDPSSGSSGNAALATYGIVVDYSAKAVTDDLNCPMNEEDIVWFGIEPTRPVTRTVTRTVTEEADGEEVQTEVTEEVTEDVPVPHNYKVLRRIPSLNSLTYYLKEVDLS